MYSGVVIVDVPESVAEADRRTLAESVAIAVINTTTAVDETAIACLTVERKKYRGNREVEDDASADGEFNATRVIEAEGDWSVGEYADE
jgi:hypothetical protein